MSPRGAGRDRGCPLGGSGKTVLPPTWQWNCPQLGDGQVSLADADLQFATTALQLESGARDCINIVHEIDH